MVTAAERFLTKARAAFELLAEEYVRDREGEIRQEIRRAVNVVGRARLGAIPAPKTRTIVSKRARAGAADDQRCRAPWCRKEGARRHRMFCADHKDLPEAKKDAFIASWKKRKGS